jgi:putative phosphoribosyl transferase
MQHYKNIFDDRKDAAKKLLEILPMEQFEAEETCFIALSKGGLQLGEYINFKKENSLDMLFLEAVTAPKNSECELACVSETEEIVLNENLINAFEIEYDYIYGEAHRKHEEDILSHIYRYRKGRHFPSMQDRVVLLFDEGGETGTRFITALKTVLKQKPKAVYVAAPVLSKDLIEVLERFVDASFVVHAIADYVATEFYYKNLNAVDDETIEKILEENR